MSATNATGPGLVARLQSELAEKDETIVALRQAIWDTFAILGGDTDGDKTPNAMVSPPLPDFIRTFARETRKDYDDACAELANLRARCEAAERDAVYFVTHLAEFIRGLTEDDQETYSWLDRRSALLSQADAFIAAQHAQRKED